MSTAALGSTLRATFDCTHLGRTFAFSQTSAALELVDSGQAKGKVVITMPAAPAAFATATQTRSTTPHRRTP